MEGKGEPEKSNFLARLIEVDVVVYYPQNQAVKVLRYNEKLLRLKKVKKKHLLCA